MDFIHKIIPPKIEEFLIKLLRFVRKKAVNLNWKGAKRSPRGRAFSVFGGNRARAARYVEKA
jgi:hypothetical protein